VVVEVVEWFYLILYIVHCEVGEGFGGFETLLQYRLRFFFCPWMWYSRGL